MFLAIKDGAVLLSNIKGNKMEITEKKEWLTPKELQKDYLISTSTQAKYRMDRKIPFSKIGRYIRYSRDEINKWFEANVVQVLDEVA